MSFDCNKKSINITNNLKQRLNNTLIMKKIIVVVALLLTVSLQAQDNSEFKKQTIEFLKLTGSADMFDNAISQIGMMVPEKNKEAYTKEAKGTLDGLYGEIAELYMKEFTQDEIAELVAFYKSEIGQKLSSKQTQLTQQGMMLGQNWGMELQQIAQKHSN